MQIRRRSGRQGQDGLPPGGLQRPARPTRERSGTTPASGPPCPRSRISSTDGAQARPRLPPRPAQRQARPEDEPQTGRRPARRAHPEQGDPVAPDVVGPEVDRLKSRRSGDGEVLAPRERPLPQRAKRTTIAAFAQQAGRGHRRLSSTTPSAPATGPTPRSSASPKFVPVKAAGYLMKKEVDYLRKAVHRPGQALCRHPRRGQGRGQDPGHREPPQQGRRHPHRRGHGLHVPQGPGPGRRQVARRGRQDRDRREDPGQSRREEGRLPPAARPRPGDGRSTRAR